MYKSNAKKETMTTALSTFYHFHRLVYDAKNWPFRNRYLQNKKHILYPTISSPILGMKIEKSIHHVASIENEKKECAGKNV